MTFLAFFLMCQATPPPLVNLEDHDIFSPSLVFYQVGDGVLVCSARNGVLQIFDSVWRPTHRYDRKGPGPQELEQPFVLGVTSDHIFVVSHGQTVIPFDHQLQIVSQEFPPISGGPFIHFGIPLSATKFRIYPRVTRKDLIYDLELEHGAWVRKKNYSPDPQMILSKFLAVHGPNTFIHEIPLRKFADVANFKNSEEYEIEVHQFGENLEENLVQVLSQATVGLEGHRDHIRMIGNSFRWERGYKVPLNFIKYPDYFSISYLDSFTEDGTFAGRQSIDSKWKFHPVHGSNKVLQVDRDSLLVYRFHL